MRILLKAGFLDMYSAKTLVVVIRLKGVKYKSSEFVFCSEDLGSILGCNIFKRSLRSEQNNQIFDAICVNLSVLLLYLSSRNFEIPNLKLSFSLSSEYHSPSMLFYLGFPGLVS